jgi:hypothetical protein
MIDDISFLVDETFKNFSEEIPAEDIYEGPGLIYKIEKTALMFVVRAMAFKNIKEAILNLENDIDFYSDLRLEEMSQAMIFKTDDVALAQIAAQSIANRRFPFYEEHFLNISDPSMSWWMGTSDDKIEISFRMINTNQLDHLIKLGPLADSELALHTFKKLKNYFQLYFSVEEFAYSDSSVCIKSQSSDKFFHLIRNLFITGEPSIDLINQMKLIENHFESDKKEFIKFANFYLLEIATTRRFWLDIMKQIN